MNRYRYYDSKKLDEKSLEKYGHKWYKEYEDGDEHRAVFPERDSLCGNNIFLYHRYKISSNLIWGCEMHDFIRRGYDVNKRYVYMTFCHCNHYGNLCSDCKTLNTTDYLGLSVPLCPEDFMFLQKMVSQHLQWNDLIFYGWLEFWITEYTKYRYNYSRQLKFWNFKKFRYMSLHQFFRYLFQYIKEYRYKYTSFYKMKPMMRKVSDQSAHVRSGDAVIKLSIEIFQENQQISDIKRTKNRKWDCISWIPIDYDAIFKKMLNLIKPNFDLCVDQIKNEVAFRPGKWKMQEAEKHFINLIQCQGVC